MQDFTLTRPSQRRYKGDTYAIPYAGEEVMLHWANKDQYYTKSGENFSNYSFKLDDGRTVHFRLVAADTAKDNRKDNDKERRFALVAAKTVTRIDDQGDEYEESIVPVEEAGGELTIRFEYAAQPKGTKQEALVKSAVETVLADAVVKDRWADLARRVPTEKNPQRTLLEKHLTNYTAKNTADYFIHKDLGGFLRRELDFYIKNEVMHLDDVQNAGAFADIEKNLRMIQCLRAIALELIAFLAQLEDFQKKLWLKKKFVVSSHYCITLDRVPETLWPEVAANERQWAQWRDLGVWEGDGVGTLEDLKASLYRMVDTELYSTAFKSKLLQNLQDLELSIDGLLIQGDNFHALSCLRDRYKRQIKCIYIDPPYNRDKDDFTYKDSYKHSSWLSMMRDRIVLGKDISRSDSVLFQSIGNEEVQSLKALTTQIYGEKKEHNVIHWKKNQKPQNASKTLSESAEYVLVFFDEDPSKLVRSMTGTRADEDGSYKPTPLFKFDGRERRIQTVPAGTPIEASEWSKGVLSGARNKLAYIEILDNPIIKSGVLQNDVRIKGEWSKTEANGSYQDVVKEGRLFINKNGFPNEKSYRDENSFNVQTNLWLDAGYNELGKQTLDSLFGESGLASYPKPIELPKEIARSIGDADFYMCDYFAGTGTTGHAIIDLNREDGGKRKYILIESGDVFSSVLKPRIEKVVYARNWEVGTPRGGDGISHAFKYSKIESYEDSLNNLRLRRDKSLEDLPFNVQDDYLLHYMLDVESRGSLLSVADFRKPFDYRLNIAVDSAGAFEPRKVDLVETFNYLIGLRVKHIDAQPERGFVTVTGTLPSGESCLVLWRDCEVLDYEGISKLCDRLAINPADSEFDVVYLNGDHNIPTVLTQTAEEGGATRVLKLRPIEPEFLERMFNVEDV